MHKHNIINNIRRYINNKKKMIYIYLLDMERDLESELAGDHVEREM
jgi:hypothetical protein